MTAKKTTVGIIGGTGWLGASIAKQLLRKKFIKPNQLWISNRSGKVNGFEKWPEIHFTKNNQQLADNCNIIILSVRPRDFPKIAIQVEDQLLVSVMAGVNIEKIQQITAGKLIVRTMPNVATEVGLSFTPWFSTPNVDKTQQRVVEKLLKTFGSADKVANEDQMNFFTALTGSGQGFVAYYVLSMIQSGINYGLSEAVSEHAIRQLFHGMGRVLADSKQSIAEVVQELLDYAGTTAAGIKQLKDSNLAKDIDKAVLAAYQKAKSDMTR